MTEKQIAELVAEIDAPFAKWPSEGHMVEQAIRRTLEIVAAELTAGQAELHDLRIAVGLAKPWRNQAIMGVQIQPDWSKAPGWARWWAIDEDGCAYWYENEPTLSINDGVWTLPDEGQASSTDISIPWQDSLTSRLSQVNPA